MRSASRPFSSHHDGNAPKQTRMHGRCAPLAVADFVSLLPSELVDLLIVGLQSLGGSVDLGVESAAQLIGGGLQIVLALSFVR